MAFVRSWKTTRTHTHTNTLQFCGDRNGAQTAAVNYVDRRNPPRRKCRQTTVKLLKSLSRTTLMRSNVLNVKFPLDVWDRRFNVKWLNTSPNYRLCHSTVPSHSLDLSDFLPRGTALTVWLRFWNGIRRTRVLLKKVCFSFETANVNRSMLPALILVVNFDAFVLCCL